LKRVYICAPYAAGNAEHLEDLEEHVMAAVEAKVAPVSPTLMFERVAPALDRRDLLLASLALMAMCDELWVFGPGELPPSNQQISEMTTARGLGIPIISKTDECSTTPTTLALFDEPRIQN
jgi:hypothetical protein